MESLDHRPVCECRCPCHLREFQGTSQELSSSAEVTGDIASGMSWANGPIQGYTNIHDPRLSHDLNERMKNLPSPAMASAAFSKSLLHVKGLAKSMKARWESFSDPEHPDNRDKIDGAYHQDRRWSSMDSPLPCSVCSINPEQKMNHPYHTVISGYTPSNVIHRGKYQDEDHPRRSSRKSTARSVDSNQEYSFEPLRQNHRGEAINHQQHHSRQGSLSAGSGSESIPPSARTPNEDEQRSSEPLSNESHRTETPKRSNAGEHDKTVVGETNQDYDEIPANPSNVQVEINETSISNPTTDPKTKHNQRASRHSGKEVLTGGRIPDNVSYPEKYQDDDHPRRPARSVDKNLEYSFEPLRENHRGERISHQQHHTRQGSHSARNGSGQWPSTAPEGEPRSSNTKDAEDHRVEIVKRSTTSEPDKTMNKIPQVTSNIQADINEESFPVPTPSPNPEYIQCISGGGKGEHPLQGCSACCINSEQEMNCPYDTVISENTPSNDVHSGEYQIETENEHLPRRPSRKNSPGVGDKNESSFVPLRQSRGGQEISHHHDGRAEERTGLPEKSSEEPTQEDAHNPAYMAWISMSKSEQNVKKNSLQQENGIGRNRSADAELTLTLATATEGDSRSSIALDIEGHGIRIAKRSSAGEHDKALDKINHDYDHIVAVSSNVQVDIVTRSISVASTVPKETEQRSSSNGKVSLSSGQNRSSKEGKHFPYSTRHFYVCHKCHKIVETEEAAFHFLPGGLDTAWHPHCFRCHVCEKELSEDDHSFYEDKPYCLTHYIHVAKIPRCFKCQELIFDQMYTTAAGHSYHREHFTCHSCNKPLVDTKFIHVQNKFPYCFHCHQTNFPKECGSCGKRILAQEPFVQNGHAFWHSNETCFQCATCHRSLVGRELFFRREGRVYCNRYCALQET